MVFRLTVSRRLFQLARFILPRVSRQLEDNGGQLIVVQREHCSQKSFSSITAPRVPSTIHDTRDSYMGGGRDTGEELSQYIRRGGCASIRRHYEEVKNAIGPYHVRDEHNR